MLVFLEIVQEYLPDIMNHLKEIDFCPLDFVQNLILAMKNLFNLADEFALGFVDNLILEDSIEKSWQRLFCISLSILKLNQSNLLK